jgi:hypothetical protein
VPLGEVVVRPRTVLQLQMTRRCSSSRLIHRDNWLSILLS